MMQRSVGVSHGANFHPGPFAQSSRPESSRPESSRPGEYRMFNKETEEAIDDVLNGRNLHGPFYTVEDLFDWLNADDVDD